MAEFRKYSQTSQLSLPANEPGPAFATLYVHVYPSRPFAAHWSFFLPQPGAGQHVGDRIHATGDRLNGFSYEYVSEYSPEQDSRNPVAHAIGRVPTSPWLRPMAKEDEDGDVGTVLALDRECRRIPVPGPSLSSVSGSAGGKVPRRREVKDCQWWIKQVVTHLVNRGILLPLEDSDAQSDGPLERLGTLPMH